MATSKGVTFPHQVWWKQFIIRTINNILGLSSIFRWKFIVYDLPLILSATLIIAPVFIIVFHFTQTSTLLIPPLLLMCFLSGVICYRTLSKEV